MLHHVQIESTSPSTQSVKVDGVEINNCVRRGSIRVEYPDGEGPAVVHLDLIVGNNSVVESRFTRIVLGRETHDFLRSIGWAPVADTLARA